MFLPEEGEAEERLLGRLLPLLRRHPLEIVRSAVQLERSLQRPLLASAVVLLLVPDQEALSNLLAASCLLQESTVILILPDLSPGTLAKAHAMGARFLSELDSDFSDVAAVLPRMLGTPEPMTSAY
ncbi:MAG: hypothetical protein AB1634_09770 [Thermodesulfobacteriota bacterium]